MKKLVLTAAIASAFSLSAVAQSDRTEQAYNKDSDYAPGTRSAYARDADELATEPCPDKFDSDWRLTNKNHPCLRANQPDDAVVQKRQAASASNDIDPVAVETDDPISRPVAAREDSRLAARMDNDVAPKRCEAEDLSDQAIDELRYRSALQTRSGAQRVAIADNFDPENASVALSVTQLRDSDITEDHLQNTFAALDDNNSDAVDRIEALDVRGLADEFAEIDYNDDGVIAENEFKLFFDGSLESEEAICIDGERVTQVQ